MPDDLKNETIEKEDLMLENIVEKDTKDIGSAEGVLGGNSKDKEVEDKKTPEEEGVDKDNNNLFNVEDSQKDGKNDIPVLLGRMLVDNDIINDNDDVKTFDNIYEKLRVREDEAVKGFIKELPQDLVEQIEAYNKGLNYRSVKESISKVKKLDSLTDEYLEDNPDRAKVMVLNSFIASGLDEENARKRVDLFEDGGLIQEEARRIRDIDKLKEENTRKVAEAEELKKVEIIKKQNEDWEKNINSSINDSESIIGKKITKKDKNDITRSMFEPVEMRNVGGNKVPVYLLQQAIEKDPKVLVDINYLLLKNLIGSKADTSSLKASNKTEVYMELEKAFNNKDKGGTSGVSLEVNEAYKKNAKSLASIFDGLRI